MFDSDSLLCFVFLSAAETRLDASDDDDDDDDDGDVVMMMMMMMSTMWICSCCNTLLVVFLIPSESIKRTCVLVTMHETVP